VRQLNYYAFSKIDTPEDVPVDWRLVRFLFCSKFMTLPFPSFFHHPLFVDDEKKLGLIFRKTNQRYPIVQEYVDSKISYEECINLLSGKGGGHFYLRFAYFFR
jgi:hypothetical protein